MKSAIAARGTTTSMMSSAWLLFATQNAFSRASIELAARAGRQHVDVHRAELGEQLARRLDVLVEPLLARALRARRPGTRAPCRGSRPGCRARARDRRSSRPSSAGRCTRASAGRRRSRRSAARTAVTSSSVAKGASSVAACGEPRLEPQDRLRDEGERALRPDDQLRQVVAGGGLDELAARSGSPRPWRARPRGRARCWRVTPYLTARMPPALVATLPPRLALYSPG